MTKVQLVFGGEGGRSRGDVADGCRGDRPIKDTGFWDRAGEDSGLLSPIGEEMIATRHKKGGGGV